MGKRGRDDDQEQQEDEERALYVDTSLDTHLVVLVSPLLSFSLLKERIAMEHSKCFPDHGEIKITALKVKREGNYYHLLESMVLKTVFRGAESWFVFADVVGTPITRLPIVQSNGVPKSLIKSVNKEVRLHQMPMKSCKNVGCNPVDKALKAENAELCSKKKRKRRRKTHKMTGSSGKVLEAVNLIGYSVGGEKTKLDKNSVWNTDGHVTASDAAGEAELTKAMTNEDVEVNPKSGNVKDFTEFGNTAKNRKADKTKSSATEKKELSNTRQNNNHELPDTSEKGINPSLGMTLDQGSGANNTGFTSGSVVKKPKKTKKKDIDCVDRSHAAKLGQVPDIMNSGVTAFGCEKAFDDKETDKCRPSGEGTPMQLDNDPKVLLSQIKPLNLVGKAEEKENDNSALIASDMNKVVEPKTNAKKRKTNTGRTSVTAKGDLFNTRLDHNQEVPELRHEGTRLSQPAEIANPEGNADINGGCQRRSRSKQTEISLKDQLNEKLKETVAPDTVEGHTDDRNHIESTEHLLSQVSVDLLEGTKLDEPRISKRKVKKSNKNDDDRNHKESTEHPLSQVSVDLLEGTKLDEPKTSKQKVQKSNKNERTSGFDTQSKNDNVETIATNQIGDVLLQPAANNSVDKKVDARSVKAMKRSKKRQVASDTPEVAVTEQVDEGRGEMAVPRSANLTESTMNGTEHQQRESGERHDGQVDQFPAQQDPTDPTDVRNLEKSRAIEIKRKKLDQPLFIDTSSNWATVNKSQGSEGASLVDHQLPVNEPKVDVEIPSDKPKKRTQKKQSASTKVLSESPAQRQLATKSRDIASDLLPNSNEGELEQHQDDASLHDRHHDGLPEVRKPEKQRSSKHKEKKRGLLSSVDTFSEHNLITTKQSEENQRNAQLYSEPQDDVLEAEHFSQISIDPLQLDQISQHAEQVDRQSDKAKKKMQKPTDSGKGLFCVEQQSDQNERKADVPKLMEEADGKHRKRVSQHEGDNDLLNEIPSQEVSSGPAEARKPEIMRPSKRKMKNLVQSSSVDTSSKGQNLSKSVKKGGNASVDSSRLQKSQSNKIPHSTAKTSTMPKEATDIHIPSGDDVTSLAGKRVETNPVLKSGVPKPKLAETSEASNLSSGNSAENISQEGIVKERRSKMRQDPSTLKTPSNKYVGKEANAVPKKKSMTATTSGTLFGDLSSESSDDGERNGSGSSTQTPSEEHSSDYSEGESKGDVVSSQHDSFVSGRSGRDKTNTNLSAENDVDLESVFRSSRSFKKAKLVASQSQLEDSESQPPEFNLEAAYC